MYSELQFRIKIAKAVSLYLPSVKLTVINVVIAITFNFKITCKYYQKDNVSLHRPLGKSDYP